MQINKLTISNFKPFGKDQSIKFNENERYLLLGNNKDADGMESNESGKTSLIESILWIITGEPPKKEMNADDVIRDGTKKCKGILVLQDDKNKIKIKRIRKSSGNELYFYINKKLQNKQVNTKTKVQPLINDYFNIKGTTKELLKDLKITNLLTFESVENFAKSKKDKERFAFISRIFNLNIWDKCQDIARDKRKSIKRNIKDINSKIDVYNDLIEDNSLPETQENIENAKNNIKVLNEKLNKKEDKYKEVKKTKKEIEEIETKKERINNKKDKVNRKEKEIKSLKKEKSKSINKLKEKIKEKNKKVSPIQKNKKTLISDKSKKENNLSKLKSKKNSIKPSINKLENKIKQIKDEIENSFKCPHCSNSLMIIEDNIKKFNKSNLESELNKYKKNKNKKKNKLLKINNKIKGVKEKINNISKKIEIKNKNEILKEEIRSKEKEIKITKEKYNNNEKHKKEKIKEINDNVAALKKEVKEYDGFTKQYINNKKDKLSEEISTLKENIEKTISMKGKYENKLDEFKKSKNKYKKLKNKLNKKEQALEGLNFWYDNFPEIKRMIIQSTLPNIENISNKYLSMMETPLEVKLSTLKKTETTGNKKQAFNIKIYDKVRDKLVDFYSRSLGGRKRIGIAICFALQEIKYNTLNNWFNFKILDELLENLDTTGQDHIYKILSQVDGQFIVTSHNNQLKDRFSNTIEVKKENGISRIKSTTPGQASEYSA